MTAIASLYAVVPHLPYYGLRQEDSRDGGVSAGGFPAVPPLDVLNMPEWCPFHDDPHLPGRTVDLVVAWNPDEAAHIEAVTGYGLQLGEPPVYYPTVVRWIDAAGTAQGLLPVGTVAARFHVTGCHPATSTVYGHPTPMLAGCCDVSLWARYDDGLWHWTGHAEKVNP